MSDFNNKYKVLKFLFFKISDFNNKSKVLKFLFFNAIKNGLNNKSESVLNISNDIFEFINILIIL